MFSKHFRKNKHISGTGFRYRGVESSRIEHLTDAVFAFAITLLVIASEVPRSYVELQASMYNFIGFIACSLLLLGIWSNHSNFYLNYGMQDRKTRTLNFLFLFVLLFYIYPLKYLFSHLSNLIWVNFMGKDGLKNEAFSIAYNKAIEAQLTVIQWQDLMLRFGMGLLLIYIILCLMHWNALKNKKELELNKQEQVETKYYIYKYIYLCLVCITSMVVVIVTGGNGSGISGCVYLLIPFGLPLIKRVQNKRLKKKFPKSFVKASAKKTEEKWTKQKALLIINEAAAEVAREDRQAVRIKANQTKKPSIPKTRMVSTNEKNNDNN